MEKSVLHFAQEMIRVLRENEHKGGWDKSSFRYLMCKMQDHCRELERIFFDTKIIDMDEPLKVYIEEQQDHLIDISNYCMMLHEQLEKIK